MRKTVARGRTNNAQTQPADKSKKAGALQTVCKREILYAQQIKNDLNTLSHLHFHARDACVCVCVCVLVCLCGWRPLLCSSQRITHLVLQFFFAIACFLPLIPHSRGALFVRSFHFARASVARHAGGFIPRPEPLRTVFQLVRLYRRGWQKWWWLWQWCFSLLLFSWPVYDFACTAPFSITSNPYIFSRVTLFATTTTTTKSRVLPPYFRRSVYTLFA